MVSPPVLPGGASNSLDSLSLTDIAEELSNMEEVGAVIKSEKTVLLATHEKETAENEEEIRKLTDFIKEKTDKLIERQRDELEEVNQKTDHNKNRQDLLKRKMQDHLNSAL